MSVPFGTEAHTCRGEELCEGKETPVELSMAAHTPQQIGICRSSKCGAVLCTQRDFPLDGFAESPATREPGGQAPEQREISAVHGFYLQAHLAGVTRTHRVVIPLKLLKPEMQTKTN